MLYGRSEFDRQETLVLHVHTGINEKKCIPSLIVTDISRKNPEVGTVVPKDAISRVGAFLLNDSKLCAICMCKSRCKCNPVCKGKRCSYIYLITIAKKRLL
jgi:hypothetical protein